MKKCYLSMLSILIAAALLIGGYAGGEGLEEEADNFFVNTDQTYRAVIDSVEKSSHNNSFNGSILIATDDGIILYGGPKAVTTEGQPIDMHTTYDIGSCSKVFTAVAVFQLIEEGRLSPEDPVTRFFPEYETGKDITIWHLLHMQSGIADYVNDPEVFWKNVDPQDLDQFLHRFYRDEISDEELLQNLYAAPLCFEPGNEQSYSNTNYHLLAMIVERVSGTEFNEYLQEHIFDVCGMEHTTSMMIADETSVPKLFMEVYELGMVNENGYSMSPVQERGAGGIHACMTDIWLFDKALLSGRLVNNDSLAEMMNFDKDYGCGLYPCGKNAYGHSGRNGTYTTQNIIIESEQFGRVYFIASTSTDAGVYGLDAVTHTAMVRLGGN